MTRLDKKWQKKQKMLEKVGGYDKIPLEKFCFWATFFKTVLKTERMNDNEI